MVPDLDKSVYSSFFEKVETDIASHDGKLEGWQFWSENRRLSYMIQSKSANRAKFNQGTYVLANFLLSCEAIKRVKYLFDLEDNVLRYMIVKKGE